jgi:tetratricopeptide (TPR) repeat protein
MNEPHDPNRTVDNLSTSANALDAGLAAGFGGAEPPRSSLSDPMPPPDLPEDLPVVPGYRVLREIARGGMGRVLAAYDLTLDRDVALKVLLPGANADRFVRESKITARLPHPGIPPVHVLGTPPDGSPFLAMKLIAGQTLAEALKTADRPRLLQAFLQVCQAVGFAHSRGVIHRDLKPANVMVGAFGEVQVMDWGLAKDIDQASRERERPEEKAPPGTHAGADPNQTTDHGGPGQSTDDRTQAGQVLGTPAYMAPEQARGEATDARADVFALGGILCAILTGQPPYSGKTARDVIRRAGAADLAEALVRLNGCGADTELMSLCRRCLSPDPADRPADGQAVAEGLSSYLNGVQERLQAAERERAVAVAREAEQRKRRKVQLALAAAVVGLLLGGGAFAWWCNAQAQAGRERDARNAEAVAALLGQAEAALTAGDAAKAAVALEAARKRSAEGGADEHAQRLGRLDADLSLLRDLDAIDQFRWTWTENNFPDPVVVATWTRAALARFGADPSETSAEDAAGRVSASVVRERIVTALDRLLRQERSAGVRTVLRRVDANPYRDAIRDALLANDPTQFVELAERKTALEQPPGFVAFLGESAAIPVDRRRELLQAAVSRRPADVDLLLTLGSSYNSTNSQDWVNERLRWFQAAVAAAPANVAALNDLGDALDDNGQTDEAIACWRKAIDLDPTLANAHNNLGAILCDVKRDYDGAIACFRKAIELDPMFAMAHYNLGNALKGKGQVDEAIASFEKAIDLDPTLANAHKNLGRILCDDKRDYDAAITCFREAIALDPKDAGAHGNLGHALTEKGQVDEAIACYKKAIALDPKFAHAHHRLGIALLGKGQLDDAIACWRKAIALDPNLAPAHINLGMALANKGQVDQAIACFKKAIELDPKDGAAYGNLGNALSGKGQVEEAIACFKKAIELEPKRAEAHFNLGVALQGKGELDAAIARFKMAIDLDPKNAAAHYHLGAIFCDHKRDYDAAIACFQKTIALDPKKPDAHFCLGLALHHKHQLDAAIASYQKAIQLAPRLPYGHGGLGTALLDKGRYAEAREPLARALELLPENDPNREETSQSLRTCERLAKLEGRLPRVLAGEDKPASAQENLDIARMCQHKRLNSAAARFSADAYSADPKLADDLTAGRRYDAARCAALAAVGQGGDAARLDEKEKARLRKQALGWLRADLALRTQQLESGRPAERTAAQAALRDWQQDSDLAGLRDAATLDKLPAEERAACEKLWADVAALLKKAGEETK